MRRLIHFSFILITLCISLVLVHKSAPQSMAWYASFDIITVSATARCGPNPTIDLSWTAVPTTVRALFDSTSMLDVNLTGYNVIVNGAVAASVDAGTTSHSISESTYFKFGPSAIISVKSVYPSPQYHVPPPFTSNQVSITLPACATTPTTGAGGTTYTTPSSGVTPPAGGSSYTTPATGGTTGAQTPSTTTGQTYECVEMVAPTGTGQQLKLTYLKCSVK